MPHYFITEGIEMPFFVHIPADERQLCNAVYGLDIMAWRHEIAGQYCLFS